MKSSSIFKYFLWTEPKLGMKYFFIIAFCSLLLNCGRSDKVIVTHSFDDYQATIEINNITRDFTVMQITDLHLSVIDSSELFFFTYSARMDKAYQQPNHYISGNPGTKKDHLDEILKKAKQADVDLIVLTGDIVNNPSKSSVNYLQEVLEKSGIDYLYTAGNHDWHYEGMQGTANELRDTWIIKSLLPLYQGKNPLYYAEDFAGINFVSIDNSTYQVNEQQLDFLNRELKKNLPTVLLCHIPVHTKSTGDRVNTCGNPDWGHDADKNFEVERRQRWSKSGNLSSTMQFVDVVKSAPNLIAVLAGHTHQAQVDTLQQNALQYRTNPSYSGAHRLIKFRLSGE